MIKASKLQEISALYNSKNGLPRGPPFVYTKERRLDPNHTIFENSTPKYTYSQNISQFCDLACSTFCMVLHGFLVDSLLNTKTASRKYSCCLTGSQRKSFNKGLMWWNFPARSQYDTKVSINCNRFQFLPQKRGESHLPWQSYICLLPSTKSFVFSGWSNSLLLKHQYRIRNMS